MANDRQWSGMMGRAAKRAANNLGIVYGGQQSSGTPKFRSQKLEDLDAYYENRQYDGLEPWDCAAADAAEYIPVRKRKPRIIYAFGKMLCQRTASKLFGEGAFPTFAVEDDPDTALFLHQVIKLSGLESKLLEPLRRTLGSGSGFVRFYYVNGLPKVESYLGKYCYPKFNPQGELESLRIRYVYDDPDDKDEKGKPKCKWYQLDLGPTSDILYDNPTYAANSEPVFEVASQAQHNLGFVQGEWFRTHEDKHSPDGYSLLEDCTDFIDELCYSMSQSSTAISYNQDPQLTIKGLDSEGMDDLVRSSSKSWNMGRDGEATFLESDLGGVKTAEESRDKVQLALQNVSRVVMLDPEKFSAQAMSGKAMEVLHGPLIELINELRPIFEKSIINLVLKLAITMLLLRDQGVEVGIDIPPGWQPGSFDIKATWPPIFPMTMTDLKEKVGVAVAAASGNLISREAMTRWLAKDFNIEDVEAEISAIAAQPVINPFGGF